MASNTVITAMTSNKIRITASATADVVVSVEGWYSTATGATGGELTPVTPTQVLDTGAAQGVCDPDPPGCHTITNNTTLTVQIAGQGGVPASGVAAVAVNLTTYNPTGTGQLYAYPAGGSVPSTFTDEETPGAYASTMTFVPLSADGKVTLKSVGADTDVWITVEGWVSAGSDDGQTFTPVTPTRLVDTTTGTGCVGPCSRLGSGGSLVAPVLGRAGVPTSGVTAVAVQLTALNPSGAGILAGHPDGGAAGISTIYNDAVTSTEMAVVPVGADGRIAVVDAYGSTDVRVDVIGWFTAGTYTYRYSPDGRRITKAAPTTTFSWDQSGGLPLFLAETTATTGEAYSYLYGPDGLPFEQIAWDGTTVFFHHDQLGSTRLQTNTNGDVVGAWSYNAHGVPTASTNAPVTHLGFAGEYTDNETGLSNLRARFYDPATGQFLSRDPADAATRSAYGYVGDNPLNGTDPSGLVGIPGTGYCIAIADPSCDNSGTQQWGGEVLAGAGNALTFGQGVDLMAKAMGKGGNFTATHVSSCSSAYQAGKIGGAVFALLFIGADIFGDAATEAAGVAEAGFPSASQLADDVASATGGTVKELSSGYSVTVPNGGRGIVVRVMESGGGRTNYYRVSIPGKEAFTVEGAASVDRALTHIDISANSLEEILQIIKGAGG
jgi:RHS repeat-associated protein